MLHAPQRWGIGDPKSLSFFWSHTVMVKPGFQPRWLHNNPSLLAITPKLNTPRTKSIPHTSSIKPHTSHSFYRGGARHYMAWERVPLEKQSPNMRSCPRFIVQRPGHRKRGKAPGPESASYFYCTSGKKPQAKSKLHNTPNGSLCRLPPFQLGPWRMSARALLRGLAKVIKSESISISVQGHSDKLVRGGCTVN